MLGAVKRPGTYLATLDHRVSELVAQAGGLLPSASPRRIEVRKKGQRAHLTSDLNAFLRRGEENANPYLGEGDSIFVPPASGSLIWIYDSASATLSNGTGDDHISPLVPREYELVDGQKFSSLVYDLGGLNPAWDLENVYVARKSPDGVIVSKVKIDIEGVMIHQDDTKDFMLAKGDVVYFGVESQYPYLNGMGVLVGIEQPYPGQPGRSDFGEGR